MSELIPLAEGRIPEAPEIPALSDADIQAMVNDSMREVSGTAELRDDDAGWLEALFKRILEPVTDIFHTGEKGYDTEVLTPGRPVEMPSEDVEGARIREAVQEWHVQEGDNSCAVCAQQFIINEFLDTEFSEAELCAIARQQGWYDPASGTSPGDVGNLLEYFGIDTQMNYEGTIQDIKNTLDQGGRAIVAVDSMALWVDGAGNYPLYGADHAVEVIGIDDSDPLNVQVILNDSGVQDGGGKAVPYLEFMEAWGFGGGFMVSAFPAD